MTGIDQITHYLGDPKRRLARADMLTGRYVYALCKGDVVVYVGQSIAVAYRLQQHAADFRFRSSGEHSWDSAYCWHISDRDPVFVTALDCAEAIAMLASRPTLNQLDNDPTIKRVRKAHRDRRLGSRLGKILSALIDGASSPPDRKSGRDHDIPAPDHPEGYRVQIDATVAAEPACSDCAIPDGPVRVQTD